MAPSRFRLLRLLPSLPRVARAKYLSPRQAWRVELPSIPSDLLTEPGIARDPELAFKAFEEEPLQDFTQVHHDSTLWLVRKQWRSMLPVAPRLVRSLRNVSESNDVMPKGDAETIDADELTAAVKDHALSLGLSAVGVAEYDPKYTFAPNQGKQVGDRIIVCVLEQNWEMTQRIPSAPSEQAALSSYAEVMGLAVELAKYLKSRGFRAQTHDLQGHAMVIHYGVEAGLGQLGLNGQLLTPAAGSRCRITLVNTNAPLLFDAPQDFGVNKICDECQVCVRRCPSGAIPTQREWHRGVWKAKINTPRCFPVVAQANGCAVCMKVCPVQRYGLRAVLEEYDRSGTILGKDTDELEGYNWPLDGRRYGPGEKPRLARDFFNPPDARFDFTRKLPLSGEREIF
jgi:ferredoxin